MQLYCVIRDNLSPSYRQLCTVRQQGLGDMENKNVDEYVEEENTNTTGNRGDSEDHKKKNVDERKI